MKNNQLPVKALLSTKIAAAFFLVAPIALFITAQQEARQQYENSDMARANFEVLKSAQNICHAYLKAGQTSDCNEIDLEVCEAYSRMGEATMCSTFSDRIKAEKQ